MKNLLSSLTKQEKNRILEMHRRATKRNYLNEGDDDKIQNLPEVTISAWMPFETAKQRASEKGGNILMYIYNDGCSACVDYTKKVMSNPELRKKIKDNNLTLSKMVMCAKHEDSEFSVRTSPFEVKYEKFAPCNTQEKSIWESFKSRFDVYSVPAMMIIDGSGNSMLTRVDYETNPEEAFNNLFNLNPT